MASTRTQTPAWQYQNEWRIAAVAQATPPFQSNLEVTARFRFNGGITSVIFGLKADPVAIDRVRKLLAVHGRKVRLGQVVRDAETQLQAITDLP
jgi:hypothetical protein